MEIKDLKATIDRQRLQTKTLFLLDLIYDLSEEEIVDFLNKEFSI